MSFIKILRIPHLSILWLSQLLSAIGDHLYVIAITWIAVKELGASAAYVIGAGTFSALFFGIAGGIYADRWNRHKTMITADFLRAFLVGLLPFLHWYSEIELWHLVTISVVVSGLGTFFNPALQASLPAICKDSITLQQTNALMDTTHRFARIFGPGLTGVFLTVFPLAQFFTLDAFTFVLSALALLLIRHAFSINENKESLITAKSTPLIDFMKASTLLKNHKILLWALISLSLVNLCWGVVYMVGVPLFTEQILKENVGAFGLIGGAYGIGNILSLFMVGSLKRNIRFMYAGHVILGIGFLVIASADSIWIAVAGAIIAAFGSPLGDIMLLTMIQTDFPTEHIGKIYSFRALLGGLGLSLGALIASFTYSYFPIPIVMAFFSGVILLIGFTGLIKLRQSNPIKTIPSRSL
ncbi:MFS transporter [Fictibacillus barbaricus]|uniref:MFS family permease n=1 Tax=Fictibacillus barbaricus TaxID=182136 RepID=A0ABU1TV62_9BACL|nr:MFS transporter [Fictibacillus barbaricus]MDR7071094.1 MFS family permease [Fictibacillus barbaricus]